MIIEAKGNLLYTF